MKRPWIDQINAAMKAENEEFSVQVRSEAAREALTAFLEKRAPDFTKANKSASAAQLLVNARTWRDAAIPPHRS
jgi:hypothetical protein